MSSAWQECRCTPTPGMLNGGVWQHVGKCRWVETVQRAIPREVLEWEPETPVQIDRKMFMKSLKTAPKGSSPGPGGCTYEHLRVLLEEVATVEFLLEAASSLAQTKVPQEIAEALTCARLTALSKPWRGQGHRHRLFSAKVGGQDFGKAIR